MGKFHRVLNPGLNILAPIIDRIKYVQSLKELAIEIPQQSAVTSGIYISHLNSMNVNTVLIMVFFYL